MVAQRHRMVHRQGRLGQGRQDGSLSRGEPPFRAGRRLEGEPTRPVRRFDENGDGRLSVEEFPGREERFERLDSDGDGYLTPEEMLKGARNRLGPRGRGIGAEPREPDGRGE